MFPSSSAKLSLKSALAEIELCPALLKDPNAPFLKNPCSPGLWMNLQLDYEFMCADREKGEAIRKEVQPCAA